MKKWGIHGRLCIILEVKCNVLIYGSLLTFYSFNKFDQVLGNCLCHLGTYNRPYFIWVIIKRFSRSDKHCNDGCLDMIEIKF